MRVPPLPAGAMVNRCHGLKLRPRDDSFGCFGCGRESISPCRFTVWGISAANAPPLPLSGVPLPVSIFFQPLFPLE